MPTLDLRNWRSEPWTVKQKVAPLMRFPDDPKLRRLAEILETVEMLARQDQYPWLVKHKATLSPEFFAGIVDCLSAGVVEAYTSREREGSTVGLVLEAMRFLTLSGRTRRGRAFNLFNTAAEYTNRCGTAYPVPTRQLRKLWKLFSPVAHLWTSRHVCLLSQLARNPAVAIIEPLWLYAEHMFPLFIGVSEVYRRFAATTASSRHRGSIISEELMWQVDLGEILPDHQTLGEALFGDVESSLLGPNPTFVSPRAIRYKG